MKRDEVLALVSSWTKNKNLIKHMIAVEAQMKSLYSYFKKEGKTDWSIEKLSIDDWGIVGLIHDGDYEKYPKEHPRKLLEELKKRKADEWLINAVESHAWGFNKMEKKPSSLMEWSLYASDELSGFIIACALVRPDKKLSSLSVDSILKKWGKKDFAKGVHREQIEMCEKELGISLRDFIDICLSALKGKSKELGL